MKLKVKRKGKVTVTITFKPTSGGDPDGHDHTKVR